MAKEADICAIVNTSSRLPQKEGQRNSLLQREEEEGNATVTETVPIITVVHLP